MNKKYKFELRTYISGLDRTYIHYDYKFTGIMYYILSFYMFMKYKKWKTIKMQESDAIKGFKQFKKNL